MRLALAQEPGAGHQKCLPNLKRTEYTFLLRCNVVFWILSFVILNHTEHSCTLPVRYLKPKTNKSCVIWKTSMGWYWKKAASLKGTIESRTACLLPVCEKFSRTSLG